MRQVLCADFVVLRTPLLSWNFIERLGKGLNSYSASRQNGDVDLALDGDRRLVRRRLRTIAQCNIIKTAIEIASASFSRDLDPWLRGNDAMPPRIEHTLLRYLTRMGTRSTPFGLFAGLSLGRQACTTHLVVPARRFHCPVLQLDVGYLDEVMGELSKLSGLRAALRFKANPDLYPVADRLRYVEAQRIGTRRRYKQVDVEPSVHLDAALRRAGYLEGATIEQISKAVQEALDRVGAEEATAFVEQLCDVGLLMSPLKTVVTGPDPALGLSQLLLKYPEAHLFADRLIEASAALRSPISRGYRDLDDRMRQARQALGTLVGTREDANLFRTTVHKFTDRLTISRRLASQLAAGAELLMSVADSKKLSSMEDFRQRFQSRYGAEIIPLLDALDPDNGVGFGSSPSPSSASLPLIGDWPLGTKSGIEAPIWTYRDAHLLKLLHRALSSDLISLELEDTDIDALAPAQPHILPPGLSALVVLSGDPDRGSHQIFYRRLLGPTSARLLGRFAGTSAELEEFVRAILRQEEERDKDAVHAEIVHLPQSDAGNVICRPVFRDWEIPIVDGSGAPLERQLALRDLRIRLVDGQVRLYSERLGRRVMPHLSCAHAFDRSELAEYRFLAELSQDGVQQDFSFSWGALSRAPYLPRLTRGRTVLSLARWSFASDEFSAISLPLNGLSFAMFQSWRFRHRLPRRVSLDEGDRSLYVDLENVISIEQFVSSARRLRSFVVVEWFPEPSKLAAGGHQSRYAHELVVPFLTANSGSASQERPPQSQNTKSPPKSDSLNDCWVSLKLYCSQHARDRVLADLVGPFMTSVAKVLPVRQWFFVRFDEPRPHIRLRAKLADAGHREAFLAKIFLLERSSSGLIASIESERYDREVARYGGADGVEICERAFCQDSYAAFELLRHYKDDQDAIWMLTLVGAFALLDDLHFNEEHKWRLLLEHRNRQRTMLDRNGRERMRSIRRERRDQVRNALETPPTWLLPGIEIIHERSLKNRDVAEDIYQLAAGDQLTVSVDAIAVSLVHMWINRVTRHAINLQEMIISDLIVQYLEEKRNSTKIEARERLVGNEG
ncbi:lantibiotic dehydratase (plasmid) [Rhizobium beringeri]|uniref:lantibiotic dehydratase n=1 Tax=Rhizobium beringeri TaxID=3019934 RepID=UPI002DDCA82B|nr:lantibiotic dehydratase [Rhizobium beringeri]WSG91508.1 lantibiotic dehydratase [Rhizobium beringeri]